MERIRDPSPAVNDGAEVDIVGSRKLQAAAGQRFAAGVVLYDGETSAGFGDCMFAVPIRALWEGA